MLLRRNAKCYEEKSYYQICHCLKVKQSFHEKLFQKEKSKLLLWIYAQQLSSHLWFSGCWKLLASTETPGELPVLLWQNIFSDNFSSIKNVFITIPWIFERFLYRHILQLFLQAHSAGITSWWLNEQYIRYFPEKVIWYIV